MFGLWNGVDGDDLRPRQGGPPIDPTDTERLHYNFGLTCRSLISHIIHVHIFILYVLDEERRLMNV